MDQIKLTFVLKLLLISGLVAKTTTSSAQAETLEYACDTTIQAKHCTRCVTDSAGQFVAIGNRNEQLQRHGWWYELSMKGRAPNVTEYHNGLKIHERWRRGCLWRIDENGTVISKGKADRRSKTMF